MLFRFLTAWVMLMLICGGAAHAESKHLSLRDAIFLSLAYNTSIQTDEIRRIADKFNLQVAYNRFEWQYGLAGSANYTTARVAGHSEVSSSTSLTPTANKAGVYGTTYALNLSNPTANGIYNPGITMTITQPLMRGFGKAITLTPLYDAVDNETMSRLNYKNTVIQTVTQVINAYNALIQAHNQVEISQLTLAAYKLTISEMRANIKAGRRAPTDILQAESNYASELISLRGAKNRVATTTRDLLNLIGLPPENEVTIDMEPYLDFPEIPKDQEAFQIAMDSNIQYQSDLLSLKTLRRALVVAKDGMRPQLNFTLNARTGAGSGRDFNSGFNSLLNNKNTSISGQLDLDIPIRNYNLRQNLLNAQVQLSQAELNFSQLRRTLKTMILNNIADTKTSAEQIKLSEKAIDLRRQDQEFLNTKLRYGLTTVFEVNTRQQELSQALNQLVNDKINYINSLTVLYANMGILLDVWQISIDY